MKYLDDSYDIIEETSFSQALIEAYTYTTNSSTVKSEKFIKKEDVEFSVQKHIQISPCSEHKVTSYIKMIQGYARDYVLHAKITGTKGRRLMTAEELKDELTGMDYVEDYGETAIVAKAGGTIVADMGIEAVVGSNENALSGCNE